MTTILIKDIPPATLLAIEAMAAANHLTLEEQAREIIMTNLIARIPKDKLLENADRIAAMTPKGVKQTDSAILIREDRDR